MATRAAASSKSLIVLAEALVRDLDYDHSRFFSDMVPNTSSCFGLPPDVRNRNCPPAYCLIARSCASVEDMVAWDGAYSGEAFEDFGEQFILSLIFVTHSNVSFTSIFTPSVSNKHEPLHQTGLGGHEVLRVLVRLEVCSS